jgi:hypothetical protein
MNKLEETTQGHSRWRRAEQSEPVFVLRGGEKISAQAVRAWCALFEDQATQGHSKPIDEADRALLLDAQAVAQAMERYSAERKPLILSKSDSARRVFMQELRDLLDRYEDL